MKSAVEISKKQLDDKGEPIWNPKEVLQMLDNLGNANQQIDLSAPTDEPPQLPTLKGSPPQPPEPPSKK
jgi:hypothetical protein